MSKDHTANYLASVFLGSKRCLKKIYDLNTYQIAIIRYLCDCMDKNYKKYKKLEIKISQNQIAIYTFTSRQLVNRNIKYLVKKRILIKLKKNVYSVGKVLIKCNGALHPLDVSRSVTDLRCVTEHYISNSSNYTNSEKKSFSVDKSKEPKSMVKFWEPGNPDYDRVKNK